MSFGTDPPLFFPQHPAGSWRVRLCSYGAQPGTGCSGRSAGGTLLRQQNADLFGWFLMESVWICTVGPTLLESFRYLTYSSPHELDNEI